MTAGMQQTAGQSKPRALIVDDEAEIRKLLSEMCRICGIDSRAVAGGKEALEIAGKEKFTFFVVDLNMPEIPGPELIAQLLQMDSDSAIIVLTGEKNPEVIVDIMKHGAWDYLVKPITVDQFEKTVNEVLKKKQRRFMEKSALEVGESRLRTKLEWMTYKDKRSKEATEAADKNVIYNLRASLSQGDGFGALISLIDIIRYQENENGDTVVDKELMKVLSENADYGKKIIDGLDSIVKIYSKDAALEKMHPDKLMALLHQKILEMRESSADRGLVISEPETRFDCLVAVDKNSFCDAFEELLVNACKYSAKGSEIDVFVSPVGSYLCISVKSELAPNDNGIPKEMEETVQESFFRLHPPSMGIKAEKFGLGLGLTVVNQVMRKHNGTFTIGNVNDHTHSQIQKCVLAQMFLPMESAPAR